jgi:ferric enterobactin receptor
MKALLSGTLVVLLCTYASLTYAANNEISSGEVTGKIIEEKTQAPVAYASVALFNAKDSALIAGVITDEKGEFHFENLAYGNYKLKASFVGYKTTTLNEINVSRKNKKVEIKEMRLSEEVTVLKDVVVVGERLKGEEKIDRTVFTLNDQIVKSSHSGLDVLKQIPAVSVDFQNNVSLAGKSDIEFYVDGVLRDKNYVAQLDPKVIDKVEILTNPGVKYSSDISGVINIVLKKEKRTGLNGSLTAVIPSPNAIVAEPNANLEWGNKKFRVFAADRFHYEKFSGTESLTTETSNTSNPYRFERESSGINGWQNNYMNYGADWFINDKTSLSFLGEWERQSNIKNDYYSVSKNYENNQLTKYFETNQDSKWIRNSHLISLFLKRSLEQEGSEITAEANIYLQSENGKNSFTDRYFDPNNLNTEIDSITRGDVSNSQSNVATFKADYTFNLKKIKNETGIRLNELWMNNDFTNSLADYTGELYETFSYRESRQAAYYNLTGKIKNISWQAGLRGEYSNITIEDSTIIGNAALLPQISLSRNFGKNQSLKLTYRKKVNRPYISDLNPFVTWTDSLHVRKGNPELKPAFENNLELAYSKNFGSNFVSPKIYTRFTKNDIQDMTILNDQGITEVTRANIGKDMEYGIGLTAAIQLFKIWRINADMSLGNHIISSDQGLALNSKNEKICYRINGSTSVQLPKKFSAFAFAYYNSPDISYQRESSRDLLILVGANKELGDKAKINVIYNPFIHKFTYGAVKTASQGYNESWKGQVDASNLFIIELTYNFSSGSKVNQINRSVDVEKGKSGGSF